MNNRFDIAVIGAGPGGYVAAIRAAQLGFSVALVEKYPRLGGTCLNVGCIPSKAMLESSEWYYKATHAFSSFGIEAQGLHLNLPAMLERKDKIVAELTQGIGMLMKKNKIRVVPGRAELLDGGRVRVVGEEEEVELQASHVILATGSAPVELPFLPFDGDKVVSSTEALAFDEVPKRLAVIGAGAVGLELGSVWNRLGAEVTVIEMLDQITPFADKTASKQLMRFLKAQGLDIRVKTKLLSAEVSDGDVTLTLENAKGETETLKADKVLVSVGRKPYTEGLGLEDAGVELDERGRIRVDEHFLTTQRGIYAIGDVIPGPMLAHKAEEDGVACVEKIAGKGGHVDYALVPNVVYTEPELAMVGLTDQQAKEAGHTTRTGKFFFKANGRAKSLGEEDGFVQIVADADSDRVLGVHIVGPRASDLIHEAAAVLAFHGSSEDIARMVHAHPTLAETVKEAALAVDKRPIHG